MVKVNIKIALVILLGIFLTTSVIFLNQSRVLASQYCNVPPSARTQKPPLTAQQIQSEYCYQCAGGSSSCADLATQSCTRQNCDFVKEYIDPAINLLSGLVGVVVVIGIIIGSIEYASSAGDPQKVAKGRARITNSLIALFAFFFLWAFLQFLVPGGLFN